MKKFLGIIMSVLLIGITGLTAACGEKESKFFEGQTLKIDGSTSVGPLMEALIGKYIELTGAGDSQFNLTQTGSGTGITNAMAGTVDFGMSSRELKSTETGLDEFLLNMDGIAVIVNNSSLETEKTLAEIKTIFTVKSETYHTVSREAGSGTRGAFEEIVGLKDVTDAQFNEIANKTGDVITKVAANTKGIGYISLGSLNSTVKALKVGGVEATAANVISGTYALARPFLIISKTGQEQSGLAKDFRKFLASKQAQEVILSKGYVSIYGEAVNYVKPAV